MWCPATYRIHAYVKVASKSFPFLCFFATLTYGLVFCVGSAGIDLPITVPDDYPTIQAAIDNASEGNTILVKPGTYTELLRIYKSLTILGSGAASTVIEGPGGGSTVEISKGANNVVFAGFTVKGTGERPWSGIYVRGLQSDIRENLIVNHWYGIHFYDSSDNILRNNNMSNNEYNLRVWGLFLTHFLHDIDSSNLVNGKPVYYWVNQRTKTVPLDAGFVALVNSSDISVRDLALSNNMAGVLLAYASNCTLFSVNASENERGLYLVSSHSNNILKNNLCGNGWSGISLVSSRGNFIMGNTMSRNKQLGIRLSHSYPLLSYYSSNNVISGNIFEGNTDGIYFERSNNNEVRGNAVLNNSRWSITLDESLGNIFWKNTLAWNGYGIWIYGASTDNFLSHNCLVNNTVQVDAYGNSLLINTWNDDYPSGGNYWSDYDGFDVFCGRYQNETGSDGIGDTPYVIDANNRDPYPLFTPPSENTPPIAQFTYEPLSPQVGDTVNFMDTSHDNDGEIILLFWGFENSHFYINANATKKFEEAGKYAVSLTVFDDEGTMSYYEKDIVVLKYLSILLVSVRNEAFVGETITITTTLLDYERGTPLTNSNIYFYIEDAQTIEQIGLAITNSTGMATISYTPTKAGDFRINAVYEGDQIYTDSGGTGELIVNDSHSYLQVGLIVVFLLISLAFGYFRWKKFRRAKEETE